MKKAVSVIKAAFFLYCTLFTLGTLINSIGVLYLGLSSNPDVHEHIMLRAGLMLLISIIITLVGMLVKSISIKSKTKNRVLLNYTLACAVILLLLFLLIWAMSSGYLWISAEEIHPDAFRDLSRSVLIPATVIATIGFFIILIKKRKVSNNMDAN